MASVKRDCQGVLLQMLRDENCSLESKVDIYLQAEKYTGLDDALSTCARKLSEYDLCELQQQSGYINIKQTGL